MHCPFCNHIETQVLQTRESDEGDYVRRRRRCLACDERFTTFERAELFLPQVVKRDGRRSDFSVDKLRASMQLALRKRPVGAEQVEAVIRNIVQQLRTNGEREIQSQALGALVMQALQKLDQIAYVRFASVYRNFKDVGEFAQIIQDLDIERKP